MDPVSSISAGEYSTRDLGTFNRWLCVSRLRAAAAVAAFALGMRYLQPGQFDLAWVLAICVGLVAISVPGLTNRRITESMTFFVLQTSADLAAVTIGLGVATHGLAAILMRPLFAVVIVPAALISVPIGLVVAAIATGAHAGLLLLEHGGGLAALASLEGLAPPFLFFLVAQQCFFYGGHLERKNTALAGLADEVRAASALKSEFVGAVSHELRSPLNVILGYLEMAVAGDLGPMSTELDAALRRTQHQSRALLEMITALLDLNRFEAGRVPLEREAVAVDVLIAEVVEQVPDGWRQPGVALHATAAAGLPLVDTDRGKLKTILRNLVHNALKFTPAGEVRVGATRVDGAVRVTVGDTGCGIPDEALGYVFDMFRQVPGSGGGGVGLGLHIVRRLVDAIGARVEVTSRPGQGTTFTITLPAAPAVGDRAAVPRAA